MKKIYPLIFCILFFIKAFSQSPVNIKNPQYLNVTQAYVYIESQESQLVAIKNKYPELDLQTKIASQEFNSNFGLAKKNMIAFLQKYYGINYTQVENFISKEITNIVNQIEIVNKSVAEDYIADVRRKAKGSIDSPILETLLSFQYLDNPEKEFTAGFINTFKTKGHPKAKGTDWQVSIPRSWKPTEGVRPNIIQLFNSENGDGLEVITLMVKDLGLPKDISRHRRRYLNFFLKKELEIWCLLDPNSFLQKRLHSITSLVGCWRLNN
jgi:hypothetical protein